MKTRTTTKIAKTLLRFRKSFSSSAAIVVASIFLFQDFIGKCETISSRSFVSLNDKTFILWNFKEVTFTTVFLGGSLLANLVAGNTISRNPKSAEIAWQRNEGKLIPSSPNGTGDNLIAPSVSTKDDLVKYNGKGLDSDSIRNGQVQRTIKDKWENRMGRKGKTKREKLRLELLKKMIKFDQMKCFPKLLCGLSVDSSLSSSGIDSHLVRNYIHLMRSAKPEDDSSDESRPTVDNTKDALSLFLMRSGILPSKKKKHNKDKETSTSTSSSEEDDLDTSEEETLPQESSIEKKNEQLKKFLKLSKRKLAINDDIKDDELNDNIEENYRPVNDKIEGHYRPVLFMSQPSQKEKESVVSSWIPWIQFSFGADSFEKDPFFKGKKETSHGGVMEDEAWKKELDQLAIIMKLKTEIEKNKRDKNKKRPRINVGEDVDGEINEDVKTDENEELVELEPSLSRDLKTTDDEIEIYSTAVDIGKKLKDPRQCDYLYNGCPIPYSEILKIITTIRKDIQDGDKTVELLSNEMHDFQNFQSNSAKGNQHNKKSSKVNRPSPQASRKKNQQNKQQQSEQKRKNVHQNQSPMTKISHTLPNGEKVEINVQLSGKDSEFIEDDEFESFPEEQAEEDLFEDDIFDNEEVPILSYPSSLDVDDEKQPSKQQYEIATSEEEPAISASYELDDEKQNGDFRKPTPLDIFNKISQSQNDNKNNPQQSFGNKYVVSRKPPSRPAKPSQGTTRRPPRLTTKRPIKTPKPMSPTPRVSSFNKLKPMLQPNDFTSYSEETFEESLILPSTTSTTKRPKKTSRTTTTTTTRMPKTPVTTSKPSTTKRPRSTTSYTTKRPKRTKSSTTEIPSTTIKTNRRKKPNNSPSKSNPTVSSYNISKTKSTTVKIKTTTNSPQVKDNASKSSDLSKNKTESAKGTKSKPTRRRRPTNKRTTTTTLSPLAILTKSVMDEVIDEFYYKKRIPSISNISVSPNFQKYPEDKRKTQEKETHSETVDSQIGSLTSNSETFEYDDNISIETDTHGMIKIHSKPKDGQSQLIETTTINYNNLFTSVTSTTQEPKLFENPESKNNSSEIESVNGKKRIKYKNPKLSNLVILNSSTLEHPNPIIISSESSVSIGSSSKTIRQPIGSKPNGNKGYKISNKRNSTTYPSSQGLDLPSYLFEPGSSEHPHWVTRTR